MMLALCSSQEVFGKLVQITRAVEASLKATAAAPRAGQYRLPASVEVVYSDYWAGGSKRGPKWAVVSASKDKERQINDTRTSSDRLDSRFSSALFFRKWRLFRDRCERGKRMSLRRG